MSKQVTLKDGEEVPVVYAIPAEGSVVAIVVFIASLLGIFYIRATFGDCVSRQDQKIR